jgi:hypothetical protein
MESEIEVPAPSSNLNPAPLISMLGSCVDVKRRNPKKQDEPFNIKIWGHGGNHKKAMLVFTSISDSIHGTIEQSLPAGNENADFPIPSHPLPVKPTVHFWPVGRSAGRVGRVPFLQEFVFRSPNIFINRLNNNACSDAV